MVNWYMQNGKESDVIISSRVRLSRNIKGIPFVSKCSNDELKAVYTKMKEITPALGYGLKFIPLKDIDELNKQCLVEKNLISLEFAKSKNPYTAIMINDEENICIIINEEDHIKLQVFSSGLDLENLMNLAIEIDQKLEEFIPYSFHHQYGYLTACPTNVGTGLKVSVLAHIPALELTGNVRKILNVVNNLGISIRGVNKEEDNIKGQLYQITNNQTLGVTEKEITKNLKLVSQKIIEQERIARKFLAKKEIEFEDKVYRDYGILTNARKISEDEAIDLLSMVKMGTDLGVIKELNDQKIAELNLYTKPANLQKLTGKNLSEYDQDIERAKVIKNIISGNTTI